MKRTLKKFLVTSVAAGTFIFNPPMDNYHFVPTVHAEIKTYIGIGKCVQGDLITIAQAKNYAKLRAELNAKEQAGVYISNYSKVENFNLTENKIDVITNSIINIVGEVQYTRTTGEVGGEPAILYTATLKANIDTDGITAYIQRNDQFELQSMRNDIKNGLDKIDTLIERYNKSTTQAEKDKIRAEFNKTEREILAWQKVDEGADLVIQGKYQEALKVHNEALQLNPNLAEAYSNRGIIYAYLGQYNKILPDLNKAIELNPNRADIYVNRGSIEFAFQERSKALADYNRAIELDPNLATAYLGRGMCYLYVQVLNEEALTDFNKAIELAPNYALAYEYRGLCYKAMKQKDKAKADFAKAKQLGYKKPK